MSREAPVNTLKHIPFDFASGFCVCLHIMQHKNFTAFYRPMSGHSAQHQRKLVRAYVDQRGGRLISEYTADIKSGNGQRDDWITRARADEVAVVAGLFVVPEGAAKGRRPSADYAGALTRLQQRAGLIVDVITGTTSADGDEWANLVQLHATKVSGGRILTRDVARKMHAKSRKSRGPSILVQWAAPNMSRERERWSKWWRDPQFPSAQHAYDAMLAAMAALPEDDQLPPVGGLSTAIKIFGRRKPGDKSAGGRPPKTKKLKR